MRPIAVALRLTSFESLTLEIVKRQLAGADCYDPILIDEIKQLHNHRLGFQPKVELLVDYSVKLSRIVQAALPESIQSTLILHRNGGDNFTSYLTTMDPADLLILLEEITTQVRSKI